MGPLSLEGLQEENPQFADGCELDPALEPVFIAIIRGIYLQIVKSLNLDETSVQNAIYYCQDTEVPIPNDTTAVWHVDQYGSSFYLCVIAEKEVGHTEIVDGEVEFAAENQTDINEKALSEETEEAIKAGKVKIYKVPFGNVCHLTEDDIHKKGKPDENGFRHCFWILRKF